MLVRLLFFVPAVPMTRSNKCRQLWAKVAPRCWFWHGEARFPATLGLGLGLSSRRGRRWPEKCGGHSVHYGKENNYQLYNCNCSAERQTDLPKALEGHRSVFKQFTTAATERQ